MRRLFGLLTVAALLAALVPSATLAGKPLDPSVGTVTVTTLNSTATTGLCPVRVDATFVKGKAVYVRFAAVKDSVVVSTPTPKLLRTSTSYTQDFAEVTLGANVWSWKVQLLDRKLAVLAEEQTDNELLTNTTSCLGEQVIARFPAP